MFQFHKCEMLYELSHKNKIYDQNGSFLSDLILESFLLKVACRVLWWPIAAIKKKLSKSRKNFHNREKNFGIQKNVLESKKIMKSRKKLRNREKKFLK